MKVSQDNALLEPRRPAYCQRIVNEDQTEKKIKN